MTHPATASLRALLAAATAESLYNMTLPLHIEWVDEGDHSAPDARVDFIDDANGHHVIVADSGVYPPHGPVASLIVALVNAAPGLLDEIDRLRATVTGLRERLYDADVVWCVCKTPDPSPSFHGRHGCVCETCKFEILDRASPNVLPRSSL